MIELIVKRNGEGPYNKKELDALVKGGTKHRRIYLKGDIIKCVPKGWHKHYILPDAWMVVRVRRMRWNHDRHILTEPLYDGEKVVARRRNYIDIRQFGDKRVVTIWSLKDMIIDKERYE